VAPTASANSEIARPWLLADAAAMLKMNSAAVMSTSSAELNSTNSLPSARRLSRRLEGRHLRCGAGIGRLEHVAAQCQQYVLRLEIELDADLLTIAARVATRSRRRARFEDIGANP